jgi:hypothetical protein
VEISREDLQTLRVKPEAGFLIPTQIDLESEHKPFPIAHIAYTYRYGDALFRESSRELIPDSIVLPGLRVEVISVTSDGRPWETIMTFDRELEDPSMQWLQWNWETNSYLPFSIPAVGEQVSIAGPFQPRDTPFR